MPAEDRTAADEVAALRRPFLIGVVLVLAAMAALGLVIRQANAGNHRPEGTAERWLAAVGDTTRTGVGADARTRAEEVGSLEPAAVLLPAAGSKATDGKVAFPDLEVGGATIAAGVARVPYRLHARIGGGEEKLREGVVLLHKTGDRWRVTGLDAAKPGEKVPSEGGRIPSRAPLAAFAGAVLLGALVTVGAAGLIRWAGR
jgi:hypothetical protein